MSEDKVYKDGDIVWVKLGNNWWPGEVTGPNRHPEGLIKHLKRVPYCVVKFFNENTYEYVRSSKQIFPFQCAKKDEFIRKGYSLYNSGNSFMEKFPDDVEVAKQLIRRKETSLIINDRPDSIVKAILGQPLIRTCDDGYYDGTDYREKRRSGDSVTKILNITQNRNDESLNTEKYGPKSTSITSLNLPNNKTKNVAITTTANTTAAVATNNNNNNNNNSSNYQCNLCDFTSVRQNVMILHRKMHSNRNSFGSNNNNNSTTNTSATKSTTTKTTTAATVVTVAAITTTPTTNVNNDKNQLQQNQIVNSSKEKTNNKKTKASTITNPTTATGKTRTTRTTPITVKESIATPKETELNATSIPVAATPKEKTSTTRSTRLQQNTNASVAKVNNNKTVKKTVVKEKKTESAYAAILSDFCPSETETETEASPSAEELHHSRRSLRNGKHLSDSTTGKVSAICIDLSEPKTIQKIPKKRDYSSLPLEKVCSAQKTSITLEDGDVVCLADNEQDSSSTTKTTTTPKPAKKDAEDIRRMLLADWSDDDETPTDAIVVEDSSLVEMRTDSSNICITDIQNEQNSALDVVLTSTPVLPKTSTISTARIRNIPKKDRRDVVLQDFNSDLSSIQRDTDDDVNKSAAVDLDSSSSSVVEIIEDEQQPATVITINDDDERELSKSANNSVVNEPQADESTVNLTNDKTASTATSTTTLSCFDFQEDEDEQDAAAPTISHFKKKYLSGDKLQQLATNSQTDNLKDDAAAKNRAELAEKDQRLAAEIESLLEQTQPSVSDILNTSNFEDSMSVKDLPIKERGKRIFKSRNKTRLEDKTNADIVVTSTTVDTNLSTSMERTSDEQYQSNEQLNKDPDTLNNDPVQTIYNEQVIIETENVEEIIAAKPADAISDTPLEIPKFLDALPNENKENEDLLADNISSIEMQNGDLNTCEIHKEQGRKEIEIISNIPIEIREPEELILNSVNQELIQNSENQESMENFENQESMENFENQELIQNSEDQESIENSENHEVIQNSVNQELIQNSVNQELIPNSMNEKTINEELLANSGNEENDIKANKDELTGEQTNQDQQTLEAMGVEDDEEEIEPYSHMVEKEKEHNEEVEPYSHIIPTVEKDQESSKEHKEAKQVVEENCRKLESIQEVHNNEEQIEATKEKYISTEENEHENESDQIIPNEINNTELPQSISEEDLNKVSDKETEIEQSVEDAPDIKENEFIKAETVNNDEETITENLCKIRVKSPDQLYDQAFVINSQPEEQEFPLDSNAVDARLIATTPTDENSSMGASDTGAEFGSPTSMLSDERLPVFRFQTNQTPPPEIETVVESELQDETLKETLNEVTNTDLNKIEPNGSLKEHFYKNIPEIKEKLKQQQRRYSMNFDSLQTETIPRKRQRLSVDENFLERPLEVLKPLTFSSSQSVIRPKNRHVKITPRRNVSELFKTRSTMDKTNANDVPKNISLESVRETEAIEDHRNKNDKQILESSKENEIKVNECEEKEVYDNKIKEKDGNVKENKEDSEKKNETEQMGIEAKKMVSLGHVLPETITKNNSSETSNDNEEANKKHEEPTEDKEDVVESKSQDIIETNTVSDQEIIEEKVLQSNANLEVEIIAPAEESPAIEEHMPKESAKEIEKNIPEEITDEIADSSIIEATIEPTNIVENSATESEDKKGIELEESKLDLENVNKTAESSKDIEMSEVTVKLETNDTEKADPITTEIPLIASADIKSPDVNVMAETNNPEKSELENIQNNATKTNNDQISTEIAYSPGVPPPTPQEREVVIECETGNQQIISTQETPNDQFTDVTENHISTTQETCNSNEIENKLVEKLPTPKVIEKFEKLSHESLNTPTLDRPLTPKRRDIMNEPKLEVLETPTLDKPPTPKIKQNLEKISNDERETPSVEQNLNAINNAQHTAAKEENSLTEEILPPSTQKSEIVDNEYITPITPKEPELGNTNDALEQHPLTPQQIMQDITAELENNIVMPCTPQESFIDEDCDNTGQTPLTPQAKDFIIECEPATPQGIIECDHTQSSQITPEKEINEDNEHVLATPPSVTHDKDIVEENLHLEEKQTLIEREFQVLPTKQATNTNENTSIQSQPNTLQTDADKAAEEFLIEFDNIVNHSHTVEEDVADTATVDDVINTDDLINNIIEEVHDDHQLKQDIPTTSESPIQYEPMTTYTVVTPKNSWNQIFKESFNRQPTLPAKRRQTICFEISDTKDRIACKKQALDFESVLPVNKTIKRTAERKLTLPAIETKLSSNMQQQNVVALSTNPVTLNKKIIPTAKRKLSIEDNITSFIIERPKQTQTGSNTNATGPPPLQRIRPLSRQGQSSTSLSEPPPLQSHENLLNELFQTESSSPSPTLEPSKKSDGARVIHQEIISSPTAPTNSLSRSTETKISKNKQIGVDSRGNKYVIIKTPPTDIIVQPTLAPTAGSPATATNNIGTTITIQPIARSTSDSNVNKVVTKNKQNVATTPVAASTITSRKHQQIASQVQHMKQISITVPAKSSSAATDTTKSTEVAAKTSTRNRRKGTHAQAKALATAAATAANNNINSAKHRQAMEALSRRLSIASETPPLAKVPKTAATTTTTSTHVQTQIANNTNSNLTFFADTQISNIAQQQLIQLQQQQQQQQQQQTETTTTLPPPIILNKNAHQHSVVPRKTRKISQHQQQHQQQQQHNLQQQQQQKTQLLQQIQQQQQHQLQQQQQIQQQFITQIQQQSPQQQHHVLQQPPPLQQIHTQTIQVQQQPPQQIVQQNDGIIITTNATEDDNVIDSNTQLIALPTQPYPGYAETFLLCKVKGNTCKPVDNVPLYLNHQLNELVPVPLEALESGRKPQEHQIEIKTANTTQQLLAAAQSNITQDNVSNNLQHLDNLNCNLVEGEISAGIETEQQQQQIMDECVVDSDNGTNAGNQQQQLNDFTGGSQDVNNADLVSNNGILLNIEGQQVLLDAATFAHLLANPDANTQLISDDGTEYVLTHEVLAALQMQQEQQQALELANATAAEQQQQQNQQQQQQQRHLQQTEGSDIIAVALAGSELYDNDVLTIDTSQGMQLIDGDGSIVFPTQQTGALTQQHLTPPAVVTNAVLDQSPIMSTLEVPSSIAPQHKLQGSQIISVPSHHLATSTNAVLGVGGRSNLEDSLAAIGVTTQASSIPSSLGLPITVTNPNIASKVTSAGPLNEMLQFVSHRPQTAAATAAAVAAAALAGESRIFTD